MLGREICALRLSLSEKEGYADYPRGKYDPQRPHRATLNQQKMTSRLKSMLCGKPGATPFYQRLSRDIGSQAPPLSLVCVEKDRGAWGRDEARTRVHGS
jgi:hypothetical protein